MNREEEIRAKALEIAVLMFGADLGSLTNKTFDIIPTPYQERALAIERYIREAPKA
jgi:hypothetical protein